MSEAYATADEGDTTLVTVPLTPSQELVEKINWEFERSLAEYGGTDPLSRPRVPKVHPSRKLSEIFKIVNNITLPPHLSDIDNLHDLHNIVYCCVVAIVRTLGLTVYEPEPVTSTRQRTMPKWEFRLEKKISDIRRDIGRLTSFINGNRSKKITRLVESIIHRNRIHAQHNPLNVNAKNCIDTLKQRLSVYVTRIAKYRLSNRRKNDNIKFNKHQKHFYRSLKTSDSISNDARVPDMHTVEEFWSRQLSQPGNYVQQNTWITDVETNAANIQPMQEITFTTSDVGKIVGKLHNFKSPGLDHLQNYWYKQLSCIHGTMAGLFNNVLRDPSEFPEFLTAGITYLLPKDYTDTENPSKYRPITCLPTLYKIFTSCLASVIYDHCDNNNIIAAQQNGCRKNSRGCKEQLLIDSVICGQAYTNNRNLFTAYIDYKKAFDSVPHDWLIKVLQMYKIHPTIVSLLKHIMLSWRTRLHLNSQQTSTISIAKGIFQGDALSPLWFVLAMNPLSQLLNATNVGFHIRSERSTLSKITHLLYVDDLKLYATHEKELDALLTIVDTFSNDIKMSFGLDKCRTLKVVRGKLQDATPANVNGQEIESMREGEVYKYLGIKQARRIEHPAIKRELSSEFDRRLKLLLKTSLNSRNLFKAINTFAVPLLTYSFGVLKWTKTDIEKLERTVRTSLTKHRKHHPKSSIERMSLPRNMGGRGLLNLNKLLSRQINGLRDYFFEKSRISTLHEHVSKVDIFTPLQLSEESYVTSYQNEAQQFEKWKQKSLHGRHPAELVKGTVDTRASNHWLVAGELFPETEGFMIAIQDQVIATRNYMKYIVKCPSITNDKCRYGCNTSETIQHVTSGCQQLAATDYTERHNSVCKIIHQELVLKCDLSSEPRKRYYEYQPEPVLENSEYKLYWDRTILTNRSVQYNRPDITLVNKRSKEVFLIDVAIPNANNLQSKHSEKIEKYRPLVDIIKRQWSMDHVRIVPIILSSTGIIPKNLFDCLKQIGLDKHIFKQLQKATVLATTTIVRKFLGIESIRYTTTTTSNVTPPA